MEDLKLLLGADITQQEVCASVCLYVCECMCEFMRVFACVYAPVYFCMCVCVRVYEHLKRTAGLVLALICNRSARLSAFNRIVFR